MNSHNILDLIVSFNQHKTTWAKENIVVEFALPLSLTPAIGIDRVNHSPNHYNQQERLMSPEERQRLMSILDKEGKKGRTARLVCKFLILTGARVNEALHALNL